MVYRMSPVWLPWLTINMSHQQAAKSHAFISSYQRKSVFVSNKVRVRWIVRGQLGFLEDAVVWLCHQGESSPVIVGLGENNILASNISNFPSQNRTKHVTEPMTHCQRLSWPSKITFCIIVSLFHMYLHLKASYLILEAAQTLEKRLE